MGCLAWSIPFLRNPRRCCKFKLQTAVEDRRHHFFSPHSTTPMSGKLPNYKSSYLLRFHPYPRVKPSARERVIVSLNFISSAAALTTHMVIRPPWKSLTKTLSHLTTGFLHLSCNLPTLTSWGSRYVLNCLSLTPMISGSRQRKAELE